MANGMDVPRVSREVQVRVRRPASAPSTATVGDLLVHSAPKVQADVSIESLGLALLESGREGLPVVDAKGRPLGVVTRADVLGLLLDREAGEEREPSRVRLRDWMQEVASPGLHMDRAVHSTAGEIMRPPSRVISDRSPIDRGVKALAESAGDPVLVLGPTGEVVGLLTAADVVEWLSRRLV